MTYFRTRILILIPLLQKIQIFLSNITTANIFQTYQINIINDKIQLTISTELRYIVIYSGSSCNYKLSILFQSSVSDSNVPSASNPNTSFRAAGVRKRRKRGNNGNDIIQRSYVLNLQDRSVMLLQVVFRKLAR